MNDNGSMNDKPGPIPLSEQQQLSFLVDGYLVLHPATLSAAQHSGLYRRAGDLYSLAAEVDSPTAHLDILGDNLRARIPEVDELLDDPVIDGALTTLLGPDYLLHPHSYCHRSSDVDQIFHQDGNLPWNERGHCRSHRTDWAMLFYYPQVVDDRNGPTEVVAGSQYWTVDHEKADGTWHSGDRVDRSVDSKIFGEDDLDLRDRVQARALAAGLPVPDLERRFLHVPAGTAIVAHYDLFHRGSRVIGPADARYMYKFYFARVHEPTGDRRPAMVLASPTQTGLGPDPDGDAELRADIRPEIRVVIDAQRSWARGEPVVPGRNSEVAASEVPASEVPASEVAASEVAAWGRALVDGREDQKVDAAYRLGLASRSADQVIISEGAGRSLAALAAGLSASTESTRRAAGHGLRQAGRAGIPALLRGLDSADAPTRRPSAAGLGTVAAAEFPDAVSALIRALASDPDPLVRSNAAYSLGQIGRVATIEVEAIVAGLLRSLEPGVEADNAFGAGFSRSTVRQSAAFALVQLLANHRLADRQIEALVDGPLRDSDRYVQGLIAEGLARTEHLSPTGRRRLLRHLIGRRWNPSPAPPAPPSD